MRCALRFIESTCDIAVISDDGDFSFQHSLALPDTYSALLNSIFDVLKAQDPSGRAKFVGVSLSGDYTSQTERLYCPSIPLIDGQNLKADLQAALNREVFIASHAHMLVKSASQLPEFKTNTNIFSLYLDDEICAGQFVNQALVTGANGLAGNWGHICLPWPVEFELEDRDCACGRSGCLCLFVSRAALSREYLFLSERELTAEAIFAQAEQGDIVAESAVQVFEDRLARGLAMAINLIDPEVILLSGRMSLPKRLLVNLPRKWPGYVRGGAQATKLAVFANSTEAMREHCLRGAASL